MARKSVFVLAIIAMLTSFSVVPASSDEAPAAAAFESDTVVTVNLSGGCVGRHEGTGNNIDIVVTGTVVTSGATSLSVTCHVWQTSPSYHHDNFGLVSAVSGASGGGLAQGYELAKYNICTEIHASFLTGAPYNKNCPTH
jgi:hypothetical protein